MFKNRSIAMLMIFVCVGFACHGKPPQIGASVEKKLQSKSGDTRDMKKDPFLNWGGRDDEYYVEQ